MNAVNRTAGGLPGRRALKPRPQNRNVRRSRAAEAARPGDRRRRGVLTMELVLTLPILLTVLFALFEFSLLFIARGAVVEASRQGARAATLPGITDGEVAAEVQRALGPGLGENATVYLAEADAAGEPVTVTVLVPMISATPDLLWPIGLSVAEQDLVSETTMLRE